MSIEKLEAEHQRVLEMAEALETMVSRPYSDIAADFMQTRWDLARAVLTHLSNDEALVIIPLMGDRRPHIAQLATQSRAQLRKLYDDIETHMTRWENVPTEQQWSQYRRDSQTLLRRLRARIAAEETGIYHFMPVQYGERQAQAPAAAYSDRDAA